MVIGVQQMVGFMTRRMARILGIQGGDVPVFMGVADGLTAADQGDVTGNIHTGRHIAVQIIHHRRSLAGGANQQSAHKGVSSNQIKISDSPG